MCARPSLIAAATLSLAVAAGPSASAALVSIANETASNNQQFFAASVLANDLINTGTTSFDSVTVTGYTPFGSSQSPASPTFVLNDGQHGNDTGAGGNVGSAFEADNNDDTYTITYALNLATSSLGYNLTRIRSFAAHSDSRTGQSYEVLISTIGDSGFTSLGSFTSSNAGGVNQASRLTLANDVDPGIAFFATGVDAIRFVIKGHPTEANAVYREFDVEGFAAIPEPASLAMLGVGAIGFTLGRRRRA